MPEYCDNMHSQDLIPALIDGQSPKLLFREGQHEIYWLGIAQETVFRCNTYLIRDGDETFLVDPGNRGHFPEVREAVASIVDPTKVSGMILCHQDPDVAASMCEWLELAPRMKVHTTPRAQVLLPHHGCDDYEYVDVTTTARLGLPSGRALRFIEAPFLHFPGAFVTYDEQSKYLFSGDIWAALDTDKQLIVQDFDTHRVHLDLFHLDYMASNTAARGFVERLAQYPVEAILPQHGPMITPQHVSAALDYLQDLRCGTDIVYAHLQP